MEEENLILNVNDEENISSNIKDDILDEKKVTFLTNNRFKIGDKVEARFNEALHKWQPGIIIDIDSDDEKYLIEYHDGDSARYVSPENIRLMEEKEEVNNFNIGDRVEAKYRGKGKWFPGKIIDKGRISGKYVIQYDDGDIEKDTLPENIRLIEDLIEEKLFIYKVGDRVEGNFKGRGKWSPALIIRVSSSGKFYYLDYDDGEHEELVDEKYIRLLNDNYTEEIYPNNIYKVNDKVEARFKRKGRWYPGRIARAHKNNIYSIEYDDGEYETLVSEDFIRFLLPKDFPKTEARVIETYRLDARDDSRNYAAREIPTVPAISSVAYKYSVQSKDVPTNIPGVIPLADDDSTENDPSGNIVDASSNKTKNTYKKFTYKEVEDKIYQNYFDNRTRWSSSLDIIGTYLRGQKLIYMESKSYCENKLNKLMMPSIFLSTAATVLSAIVKEWYWGAYLIASVNGIIAFLLALVNYLKLDAASEAHKITAHQYDKLQTKIEFLSGQTLLFDNTERKTIEDELENVKKKIEEIKETNQFIVPKKIRTLYPIMFNTNVFLIIKKIDDITRKKINKIKDLKNEKNYLIEVLKSKESKEKDKKVLKQIETRISECETEKRRHEENIVVLKSAFSVIDEMFMKEMENAEKYKNMTIRRWLFCGFGIKDKITDPRNINKFILGIMNPYEDKIQEEISLSKKVESDDIDQLINDLTETKKVLNKKRLSEHERRKRTIKNLKKANTLLKENVDITEKIYNKMEVYDKLERGEYDKINYSEDDKALKLNKPNRIVKLLGIGSNDEDNIKLKIHSENEERGSISGSENSDPYIDFDVCKRENES